MKDMNSLKQEIVTIGKKLYSNGFVPATSGNISIKIGDKILISPTRKSLGYLNSEDIVLIDFENKSVDKNKKASSESQMHIEIYKVRPDISSIIHAHPPKSTAFAVAGIPLNKPILAEVIVQLGNIPIAEYATPSSFELAKITAQSCKTNDAVLLANHGVVILGNELLDTFHKLETLELYAEVSLWSKLLGNVNELSKFNVDELMIIKEKMAK